MATPAAPVTGAYNPTSATSTASSSKSSGSDNVFSSETFLKILGTQMTNQNPLEPLKDTEFIAQMAQFSQLEQTTNMATSLKQLAVSGQLSQGAAMIGKSVTYQPQGDAAAQTGTVQSLSVAKDGSLSFMVDGISVSASQITKVGA
jgi:flagellar basal-body rod modification protein FlgD